MESVRAPVVEIVPKKQVVKRKISEIKIISESHSSDYEEASVKAAKVEAVKNPSPVQESVYSCLHFETKGDQFSELAFSSHRSQLTEFTEQANVQANITL